MAAVWSWCGLLLLETICFKVMVIRVTVTPLSMKQSDHSPMTSEINKALCRSLDIFCLSVLEKTSRGQENSRTSSASEILAPSRNRSHLNHLSSPFILTINGKDDAIFHHSLVKSTYLNDLLLNDQPIRNLH